MKGCGQYALMAGMIAAASGIVAHARANETCLSPYTAALIKGQEAYLHIWTLGEKDLGNESDKLVTIDADPKSKNLWHGDQQRVRRRPLRGASRGLHQQPQISLGRAPRRQQDFHLRRRHEPNRTSAATTGGPSDVKRLIAI
ncbi:MAG: hypothetical protein WCC90_21855, partial [Methylocella sp.]